MRGARRVFSDKEEESGTVTRLREKSDFFVGT